MATTSRTDARDSLDDQLVAHPQPRSRDAARTRELLLQSALRLFAVHGYAATTVREIAQDAGVNVALISRYFESKEGLFEACLTDGNQQIGSAVGDVATVDDLARAIAGRLVGLGPEPLPLLLVLRSSGDARAERIRLGFLRSLSERIAALAGWNSGDNDTTLLRAQLLLSMTVGIAVLRAPVDGPEPLASVSEDDLIVPLDDVVHALLSNGVTD